MAQGQIFVTNSDNLDDYLNAAGSPVVSGWSRKRLNATDRQLPATVEIDGSSFANVQINCSKSENPPANGEIFVQAR
jgi:hypothetical protein